MNGVDTPRKKQFIIFWINFQFRATRQLLDKRINYIHCKYIIPIGEREIEREGKKERGIERVYQIKNQYFLDFTFNYWFYFDFLSSYILGSLTFSDSQPKVPYKYIVIYLSSPFLLMDPIRSDRLKSRWRLYERAFAPIRWSLLPWVLATSRPAWRIILAARWRSSHVRRLNGF